MEGLELDLPSFIMTDQEPSEWSVLVLPRSILFVFCNFITLRMSAALISILTLFCTKCYVVKE